MKILLPNYDEKATGGGWSFIANFKKAMSDFITPNYDDADIFFLPSASMVDRATVEQAKHDGKKIVLRCDNIIRNSRNRNTGMTRMKDFADWADLVIFQSKFAEELLNPYLLSENTKVILNSTDESIFNLDNRVYSENPRYLYAKHSSDETKNWEMARVAFQEIFLNDQESVFNIVGRFDIAEEYNFDFYNNEKYIYMGYAQDATEMAKAYNDSDFFIYTYFNDACSNTLIEALMCGLDIYDPWGMAGTGGTPEILKAYDDFGYEYFRLGRMKQEYKRAMEKL